MPVEPSNAGYRTPSGISARAGSSNKASSSSSDTEGESAPSYMLLRRFTDPQEVDAFVKKSAQDFRQRQAQDLKPRPALPALTRTSNPLGSHQNSNEFILTPLGRNNTYPLANPNRPAGKRRRQSSSSRSPLIEPSPSLQRRHTVPDPSSVRAVPAPGIDIDKLPEELRRRLFGDAVPTQSSLPSANPKGRSASASPDTRSR